MGDPLRHGPGLPDSLFYIRSSVFQPRNNFCLSIFTPQVSRRMFLFQFCNIQGESKRLEHTLILNQASLKNVQESYIL